MAEAARFSLARTIHTFQNPWTRRHAPEAPATPNQWEGGGAVNPHRISVTQAETHGTSHILNAAAVSASSPRGGMHPTPMAGGSPIVGEHGAAGSGSGGGSKGPGKHRKPAPKVTLRKVAGPGMRVERQYNQQPAGALGQSESPAITSNPNHPLTAGVQHQAIGGSRAALPVGSYRSAAGSVPEWSGNAQPRPMGAEQYRSAAGGHRVIQGRVERVNDAIPMPRVPGSISGEAPEPVSGFKSKTPPRYEKGMRPYSPTAGGTPMHRRKAKATTPEPPAAAPEPAAETPTKPKTSRKPRTAKAPVETPTAPPTEKPKRTRKAATPAVEAPAAPAIAAPARAQRQPTAKETVGQPARVYGPVAPQRIQDQQRNMHARDELRRQVEAAPAETRFASPGVGQGRRKRAEETAINFQNNRAMAARAQPGGYRPAGSPEEAAQRRAAARKKLGIPDDVE